MLNQTKKENNIKEAIIEVIAFFDLFDYPLTSWEIWIFGNWKFGDNQVNKVKYQDVINVLEGEKLNNIVEQKNGFYFFAGRENIIKTRMARYNYTDKKIKRALRVAKLFKFIPWIKIIAVSNIIGSHNLKKKSDIDFFIITEPGRIWITRFFCAGLMELLGLRPKEGDEQDKICLSFFVSEEAMDLQGLMLSGGSSESPCATAKALGGTRSGDSDGAGKSPSLGGRNSDEAEKNPTSDTQPRSAELGGVRHPTSDNDIYFIYWLAGLVSIYNKDNIYEKFIKANSWLKEYLPNWQTLQLANQRDSGKGFSDFYYDLVDLLFGGLEKNVKKFQLKKLPKNLKDLINKDTRVVINDQVLKLHVKDRREEYRKKWGERLVEIEMEGWMLQ